MGTRPESQSNQEWIADYTRYTTQRLQRAGESEMNVNDAFPSKYLKASDLNGKKVRVMIANVLMEEVGDGSKPVAYFAGKQKGLVLNKTNAMIIASGYGPETASWEGAEIDLYPGKTQFNGQMVDCLKVEVPAKHSDAGDDPGF
jgi:hypothetical protein